MVSALLSNKTNLEIWGILNTVMISSYISVKNLYLRNELTSCNVFNYVYTRQIITVITVLIIKYMSIALDKVPFT